MGERLSPKAVIFDADGTLFDTEETMRQMWIKVGREMNFSRPGEDYLSFIGMNRTTIREKMLRDYGPDFDGPAFMARCVQALSDHIELHGVPLKPGTREILLFLKERGIPVGLATSTHRERTDRRLELADLKDLFAVTVTGDEVERGKPDPQIYRTVCARLGVDPADCLAVEDSENGIRSAHAAGIPVAMIPDMIPPTPPLRTMVWGEFHSLSELMEQLK